MQWLGFLAAACLLCSCTRSTPPDSAGAATVDKAPPATTVIEAPSVRQTALPAETLLALLPPLSNIPEITEALPPSSGRKVLGDGSVVLSLSREVRFRNGGYLWMMVSDYGEAPSQLYAELDRIRNPSKDYPSQQLELLHRPEGIGYVVWDPLSRNGRLRAIVAKRFLIQAEGGDVPASIAWARLFELFPLQQYQKLVSQQR